MEMKITILKHSSTVMKAARRKILAIANILIKNQKKQWGKLFLVGTLIALFSGCGTDSVGQNEYIIDYSIQNDDPIEYASNENSAAATSSPSDEEVRIPIIIHDPIAIASTGEIELASGNSVYVYLEMISGRYQHERFPQSANTCWIGDFQIALYPSYERNPQHVLDVVPIDSYGYSNYFNIIVDDYTNNGNPNFALWIGQASSAYGIYNVFEIVDEVRLDLLQWDEPQSSNDSGEQTIGNNGELYVPSKNAPSIRLTKSNGIIELYHPGENFEWTVDTRPYMVSYQWNGVRFVLLKVEYLDLDGQERIDQFAENLRRLLE